MRALKTLAVASVLGLGMASVSLAGGNSSAITDQSYQSGKHVAAGAGSLLGNCPREYREIYRGNLYCRNPEYQVLAQRHPSCPKDVWGMYRGNLYCFGRR